ncbi:MAG TPA: ABC transporter permease [Stellaceae bacterium]
MPRSVAPHPEERSQRARFEGRAAPLQFLTTPALWVAILFVALLVTMPDTGPIFHWAFPQVEPPVYQRGTFVALFLSHAGIVGVASLAATFTGIVAAIFVTRPAGRDFRSIIDALATIGQTFPPAAVLALAVPAIGFGPLPTVVALYLYGLLPIVQNAVAGIETVPPAVRDAAAGMGMSPLQILARVELPLAAPVILAGIRVAVTIGIGTATIGSTVGALTLGTPIFDGIGGNKIPLVLQGAALVALFAIVTDLMFARLEDRLRPSSAR